jgi:toxin CcdB
VKQFQVYRNPTDASRRFAPFVVVLQSHYLSLDTVVVAPLVNDKRASPIEIAVTVEGRPLVVALTEMGSVRVALLSEAVADLAAHEDEIRRALDRLFTGF